MFHHHEYRSSVQTHSITISTWNQIYNVLSKIPEQNTNPRTDDRKNRLSMTWFITGSLMRQREWVDWRKVPMLQSSEKRAILNHFIRFTLNFKKWQLHSHIRNLKSKIEDSVASKPRLIRNSWRDQICIRALSHAMLNVSSQENFCRYLHLHMRYLPCLALLVRIFPVWDVGWNLAWWSCRYEQKRFTGWTYYFFRRVIDVFIWEKRCVAPEIENSKCISFQRWEIIDKWATTEWIRMRTEK